MSNMRIITSNDFDTATLSSSPSAVANAPITNLQNGLRAKVSRMSTVASTWEITATWADAKIFNGVSLYKHNFSGGATIQMLLYSDVACTDLLHDTGSISLGYVYPWGSQIWGSFTWGSLVFIGWPASYFTHWIEPIEGIKGVKIKITDVSNANGYLELGRIYLGAYWSPNINIAYGADLMHWEEQSKQFRTDGGSLRTEGYEPYRVFNIPLEALDHLERNFLLDMFRMNGLRKDFLISCFPEEGGDTERNYTAAVKLKQMPGMKFPYFEQYQTELLLEEV